MHMIFLKRTIHHYLIVCCLLTVLHIPASAGNPLLQRKMPPTFTSLPLLVQAFTQKGTRSQRVLIAFENNSIVLMYYFQNEYEIEEFTPGFPVTDIIEVYSDDKTFINNHFLIAGGDSVYLHSLGTTPLKRITAVHGGGITRFLPDFKGTEIIGYGEKSVSAIHLSRNNPGIGRIVEIYSTQGDGITGVAVIPGTGRIMIIDGNECLLLRSDGSVIWAGELPAPVSKYPRAGAAGMGSALSRESPEAKMIWDSYTSPSAIFHYNGAHYLAYSSGGDLVICLISEKGCSYLAEVPCDGHILDICAADSTLLVTGGGHFGSRYSGFLMECTGYGDVLRRIMLSYPGAFLRRTNEAIVLQGFRNHLMLFSHAFHILATDHSPLYPTCLEVLSLDDDASEDILVGGLSAQITLADTLVKNTIAALGPQESFEFFELKENRYTGNQHRLDAFLVGIDRARRDAAVSFSAARQLPYTKQHEHEVRKRLYAARETYYRIGDASGVESCDSEIARLAQSIFDGTWLLPLVIIGCLAGGFTGYLTIRRTLFIIAAVLCTMYAVVVFHILSRGAAQTVALLSIVSLLTVSFIRVRIVRKRREISLPGPTSGEFRSFLMALGAFEHSGRATRVLESLNLLLLSIPDASEDISRYHNRLREVGGTFLDTVGPQIREITELLQSILPKEAMSLELGMIHDNLEPSLRAVITGDHPDKRQAGAVIDGIDELDGNMRALRQFVKKYPGASILEVIEEIVESKSNETGERGVGIEIINNLEHTKIVHISRHELEAICENLISNSLRALAGSDTKKITIDLYEENEFIVMAHTDTGPGIDKSDSERIFTSRESIEKGGFGLPYSRFILEKVGGSMELDSSRNGGATFLIRLRPWHLVMRSFLLQDKNSKVSHTADMESQT